MTWNPSDRLAIATIAGGSEVPDTAPKIFGDAAWNHVFGVWANDGARAGGERLPWILYQFYTDANKDVLGLELDKKYFSDSAAEPLPSTSQTEPLWVMWRRQDQGISASMQSFADKAAEILEWDEEVWSGFKGDVDHVAETVAIDPQASAKAEAVAEFEAEKASAQKVTVTKDTIDQAEVDTSNQAALKALDKGGTVSFLMLDNLVLIGGNQRLEYVEFAEKEGGHKGTLKMKSKGGAFSAGELVVQREDWIGSAARAALEDAIGRISKKTVTVQDL